MLNILALDEVSAIKTNSYLSIKLFLIKILVKNTIFLSLYIMEYNLY